jgi:hypothetical protein
LVSERAKADHLGFQALEKLEKIVLLKLLNFLLLAQSLNLLH